MENTIKLLEVLRDIVKEDKRDIAYVFNSLQRIITEAKGSLQSEPKSAEEWLKKHHYVDNGIEWNPLTSTNEGMRVSISSVLDQFVSSQQPNEWVKVEDRFPEEHQDVLVYYYGNRKCSHFPDLQFIKQSSFFNGRFECDEDISYWRELPNPPLKDKDQEKRNLPECVKDELGLLD